MVAKGPGGQRQVGWVYCYHPGDTWQWLGLIVAEAVRDGWVVGEFWTFAPTDKRTGH